MRWGWIGVGLLAVSATTAIVQRAAYGSARFGAVTYEVDPDALYGHVHRNDRPPGLPQGTRYASVPYAAQAEIERFGRQISNGDETFVRTLLALAEKEGDMSYGRPANNFCATCPGTPTCRERGVPCKTTAWGVFQWNDGAWARLTRRDFGYLDWPHHAEPARAHPWESTAEQEVRWPIEFYWLVYATALNRGASRRDAARAVFMWHSGPGRLELLLATARDYGWPDAWAYLGEHLSDPDAVAWYREKRADVDRRLAAGGVA